MENKLVLKIVPKTLNEESAALLASSNQEISFEFEPGEHTFKTDIISPSNTFGDTNVIMELNIPYSYYPDENSIFLCGEGYSGINHNSIILRNMENREILGECKNNKYGDNSKDKIEFCGTEEFTSVRNILNDISGRLVKMAEEKGLMVYIRKDLFVSAEEEKAFNDIGLLFKQGEFKGFYDAETECDETYEKVPVTSVPGGRVSVPGGREFWNVIGSTGDTHPSFSSWLELWVRNSWDNLDGCANRNCGYPNNPTGGGGLVGGHVVFFQQFIHAVPGSSGVVAILPICRSCNHYSNVQAMFARRTINAVWLDFYHIR